MAGGWVLRRTGSGGLNHIWRIVSKHISGFPCWSAGGTCFWTAGPPSPCCPGPPGPSRRSPSPSRFQAPIWTSGPGTFQTAARAGTVCRQGLWVIPVYRGLLPSAGHFWWPSFHPGLEWKGVVCRSWRPRLPVVSGPHWLPWAALTQRKILVA